MPIRLVRHILLGLFLLSLSFPTSALAVAVVKKKAPAHKAAAKRTIAAKQAAARKPVQSSLAANRRPAAVRRTTASRVRPITRSSPWTEPSCGEPTVGDNEEGEDLVVRKAAVDA